MNGVEVAIARLKSNNNQLDWSEINNMQKFRPAAICLVQNKPFTPFALKPKQDGLAERSNLR